MQAEYLQHVLESYLTPQAHEQAENYRVMLFEKVMDTVGDGADHHRPGRGGSQDGTEHRGMAPEDVQVRLHLARKPYKSDILETLISYSIVYLNGVKQEPLLELHSRSFQ